MSDKSIYSLNSKNNRQRDTIPCRIDFIRGLLKGKNLEAMVDFDNTDTDFFAPNMKGENESGQSYDTTIVLKKRQLNFAETISQIGGKLHYVKSGTTGHTFKGEVSDEFGLLEYAVKVVAYPKKDTYGDITDTRRPENAELMMIKLLSYFIAKKQTPHIVLPIVTFNTDIKTFVNLISEDIVSEKNEKYAEFVKKYKKGTYHDNVSILISEWANRGDLLDFVRKHHDNFTATHWKSIFFQVLSVLAVIQSKYPSFRHNDLKANNILVQKVTSTRKYSSYKVARCDYKVTNIGYQIKLWDFDFACIPGIVDNMKVEADWTRDINVTPEQNRYYDVHYFFNTLIKKGFCPEIMTSEKVPQEVKDFINRVVPKKFQKTGTEYVAKKGRILINEEYLTANDILKYDPYFEEYRVKKTNEVNENILNQQNSKLLNSKLLNSNKKMHNKSHNDQTGGDMSSATIPDITKFLKDSSDEKIRKKQKNQSLSKNKNSKTNSQDRLNMLIKESVNKKIKPKENIVKSKKSSRVNKINLNVLLSTSS